MEIDAKCKCDDTTFSDGRQDTDRDGQLKSLRLEVHTLMHQIKMLHHEMQKDACLSSRALAVLWTQIDTLTDALEKAGLRIRELEGLTPA